MWSSNHFLPSSYFCISRSEFSFLRIQVLLGPDFSWFRFLLVQIFYNPGFFRIQVFSGPVFSWSRFFLVKIFEGQVFHDPVFSGSRFFRSGSRVRIQVLEAAMERFFSSVFPGAVWWLKWKPRFSKATVTFDMMLGSSKEFFISVVKKNLN